MGGRWAQAGGWFNRVLTSRLNQTLSPAATACFFGGSFTHAHTHVAAGAIFRRPVHRTAVATTTQRHMHSWNTHTDRLANHMQASGPIIQSSSLFDFVNRSFTSFIRANPVAAVDPLPTRQLQPTRSMATQTQSTGKKSRFWGVHWNIGESKWMSAISSRQFYIGSFDCKVSAARHTDTAIHYLVQIKVLDEKYLARTNVSLGLLEQFVPTAEETRKVVMQWRKRMAREWTSLFRGVYRRKGATSGTRVWGARLQDEYGKRPRTDYFLTEVEAACAVDVGVRASKLPKLEKIRRINFYRESDYLTEGQARRGGSIGIYRVRDNSKPWKVQAIISSNSRKEKNRFRSATYLGCYATKLEAIEAHDQFVLGQWAQQDEPRGPLPATNLSPTRYGYDLISPPTIPPLVEETVLQNMPKKRGRQHNTPQ